MSNNCRATGIFIRELHDVREEVSPYLRCAIWLHATGVRSAHLEVLEPAISAFLSRRRRHSTFPGEFDLGYYYLVPTLGNIIGRPNFGLAVQQLTLVRQYFRGPYLTVASGQKSSARAKIALHISPRSG